LSKETSLPGTSLRHATDARAGWQAERACVQRHFTTDHAEERGLACAVSAHEANFVASGNRNGGVLDEGAASDGVGYVFKLEHSGDLAERRLPC